MKTAAIYARKSKDTEQGESMDSQINRCIDEGVLQKGSKKLRRSYRPRASISDKTPFKK